MVELNKADIFESDRPPSPAICSSVAQPGRRTLAALAITTAVSVFLAIIFISLYAAKPHHTHHPHHTHATDSAGICESPACLAHAAHASATLNASADPCVDFYEHACGGYDSGDVTGRVQEAAQAAINRALIGALSSSAKLIDGAQLEWQRRLGQFYGACLRYYATGDVGGNGTDGGSLNSGGARLMTERLSSLAGGADGGGVFQHLLTAQVPADINKVFATVCGKFYLPTFFKVETVVYKKQYRIMVQGFVTNGLAEYFRKLLLTPAEIDLHKRLVKSTALRFIKDLGYGQNKTLVEKIDTFADDVIEIDVARWQIYRRTLSNLKSYYKEYTMAEIDSKLKMTGLHTCLSEIYGSGNIPAGTKIVLLNEAYLLELNNLLLNKSQDQDLYKRKMGNYLSWLTLSYFDEYIGLYYKHMEMLLMRWTNTSAIIDSVKNSQTHTPQYKCLEQIAIDMQQAVSALYVHRFSTDENKQIVDSMFLNLKYVIQKGLVNLDWMDTQTKTNVFFQLQSLAEFSNHPPEAMDNKYLNNEYDNLQFSDLLGAVIAFRQYHRRKQGQLLTSNYNRMDFKHWGRLWDTDIKLRRFDNEIFVPAGAMHMPVISGDLPSEIVYGSFGASLAARILSSFTHTYQDHTGGTPTTDLDGLWSNRSLEKYNTCSNCSANYIQSYFNDNYKDTSADPSLHSFTLQHVNLALLEAAALKYSWKAFKDNQIKHVASKRLPAFKYTNEQMFYLAYAQSRCSSNTNMFGTSSWAALSNRAFLNSVLVSNSNFADAFKCKPSDPMRPKLRCPDCLD